MSEEREKASVAVTAEQQGGGGWKSEQDSILTGKAIAMATVAENNAAPGDRAVWWADTRVHLRHRQ